MSLWNTINNCADKLPKGYVIKLGIENGSAWVELYDDQDQEIAQVSPLHLSRIPKQRTSSGELVLSPLNHAVRVCNGVNLSLSLQSFL